MTFPTSSAPSLANWSYQVGGLTMGAGTTYDLVKLEGLDLPGLQTADSMRPRAHGQLAGLDVLAGRDVVLTTDFVSDGTSLQHAGLALATAFSQGGVAERPLWIQIPNYPCLALMGRTRNRSIPTDLPYSMGLASAVMQYHATDPRLYASPLSSTVGLGTPLGGLTFPVTFPASFGGGTVAGVITANNAGNFDTRPILVITGPCTNPTVVNATTGWALSFSNPTQTGFTVLAGDTLVIDTDLRSVQYFSGGAGAGANRKSWLVSGAVWPDLVAGINGLQPGNNTIQFTSSDVATVAGTLTFKWASAFMF